VSARTLWLRIGALTALAGALLVAVDPARPPSRLGADLGAPAGAAGGFVLFAVVARRVPAPRLAAIGAAGVLARCVLGLLAADEEVVWRRVALGELLFAGPLVARAWRSLAFGLAHRASRRLHVGTGAAFGGLYLLTGALAASVAAHWAYNVLVASDPVDRPP
jgi:membrane protease YdiL (CAAX protease family)